MTAGRAPRAWLLLAAGESRAYAGNTGYDDQVDAYYSWDSTVANHANVLPGDVVALWDKKRLLGLSVAEAVETRADVKTIRSCPGCGRSTIKERTTRLPRFRCQLCGSEFDEPNAESVAVTKYESRHDAAWTALDGLLTGAELRQLCESPKSQLSMRALHWASFTAALRARGAGSAVVLAGRRAPDLQWSGSPGVELAGGHTLATVRVRRGQGAFRDRLLRRQGGLCAFTGAAPDRVLEAGHLYSYAQLGEHHEHGGLLLRRDVHRLFDDGGLAVDPTTLRASVASDLRAYEQYRALDGRELVVEISSEQRGWLRQHWGQHRG